MQVMSLVFMRMFAGMLTEQILPTVIRILKSRKWTPFQSESISDLSPYDSTFAQRNFTRTDFKQVLLNVRRKRMENNTQIRDYLEVIMIFGLVSMFSVAFPLVSLLAFVYVFVELKLDLWKYLSVMQRSVGDTSTRGIENWQGILEFLSFCAIMFNCVLLLKLPSLKSLLRLGGKASFAVLKICPLDLEKERGRSMNQNQSNCEEDAMNVCGDAGFFIVLIASFGILLMALKILTKVLVEDLPNWVQVHMTNSKMQWIW